MNSAAPAWEPAEAPPVQQQYLALVGTGDGRIVAAKNAPCDLDMYVYDVGSDSWSQTGGLV